MMQTDDHASEHPLGRFRLPDFLQATSHDAVRERRQYRLRGGPWDEQLKRALRPELPQTDRLSVAGVVQPAAGNEWSADLCLGWIHDQSLYRFLLIDIVGHGNSPAYLGMALMGALRKELADARRGMCQWPRAHPRNLLAWAESALLAVQGYDTQDEVTGDVRSAAGAAVSIDMLTGQVQVGGQALPGFYWDHSGQVDLLTLHGPFLGRDYLPNAGPEIQEIQIEPNDRLYFLSDGFFECADPAGVPFAEHIPSIVVDVRALDVSETVQALFRRARQHRGSGGLQDDATAVCMQYN